MKDEVHPSDSSQAGPPLGGPADPDVKRSGPSRPVDSQYHGTTTTRGRAGRTKHETTVWVFRDPRKTRACIYRGFEGFPWALTDLVRKTNLAIEKGDVPGSKLAVGDVVQACVVSYYDGKVHKPQTTDDSPSLATLPYRIVVAEDGYLTAEPAIPPETAIHFNIPVTVGDLVPTLSEERKKDVLISLQLTAAAPGVADEQVEDGRASPPAPDAAYAVSDKADEEAADFMNYIAAEERHSGRTPASPVEPEQAGAGAASDEEQRERMRQRLQRRHDKDTQDFGFTKG